jgi:hypothetical protein
MSCAIKYLLSPLDLLSDFLAIHIMESSKPPSGTSGHVLTIPKKSQPPFASWDRLDFFIGPGSDPVNMQVFRLTRKMN